jgi:hypothetical protein
MNAKNFQNDEKGYNLYSLITLNLNHVLFSTLEGLRLYFKKKSVLMHDLT